MSSTAKILIVGAVALLVLPRILRAATPPPAYYPANEPIPGTNEASAGAAIGAGLGALLAQWTK